MNSRSRNAFAETQLMRPAKNLADTRVVRGNGSLTETRLIESLDDLRREVIGLPPFSKEPDPLRDAVRRDPGHSPVTQSKETPELLSPDEAIRLLETLCVKYRDRMRLPRSA